MITHEIYERSIGNWYLLFKELILHRLGTYVFYTFSTHITPGKFLLIKIVIVSERHIAIKRVYFRGESPGMLSMLKNKYINIVKTQKLLYYQLYKTVDYK